MSNNIDLINLVTTQLIQNKKTIQYNLNMELSNNGTPDRVIELLGDYTKSINEINLWDSMINNINQQEQKKE